MASGLRRAWLLPAALALAGCAPSPPPAAAAPRAQWLTELPAALARAQAENRPLLVAFGGSDWCAPCIANHAEVLDTAAFKEFADRRLVLLEVDLPRLHELPPALDAQNMAMFEGFGAPLLPAYYLFAPNGLLLGQIANYQPGGPEPFIAKLQTLIADAPPAATFAARLLPIPPPPGQLARPIRIAGAVRSAGWFQPLPGERLTLGALVEAAGGPGPTAAARVQITRRQADGATTVFEADLKGILTQRETDVELLPGDSVQVPVSLIGGAISATRAD